MTPAHQTPDDTQLHPADAGQADDSTLCARQFELLAGAAARGAGLSHDLYVRRFSAAVDGIVARLSTDERRRALWLARQWDYATPAEQAAAEDLDDGSCSHGIQLGCCPAGCEAQGPWISQSRLEGDDGDFAATAGPDMPHAPLAAAAPLFAVREILRTPVTQLLAALYTALAGAAPARRGA